MLRSHVLGSWRSAGVLSGLLVAGACAGSSETSGVDASADAKQPSHDVATGGAGVGGASAADASSAGQTVVTPDASVDAGVEDASVDAGLDGWRTEADPRDARVLLDAALLDVHFVDVTALAGIHHVQTQSRVCSVPLTNCDSESPGFTGGAAAADFDADGRVDLYVTRFDGPDLLYRNQGDGTFVDVAAQRGLGANIRSNGAAFADIDADGDLDLYVTAVGELRHYLFINDGTGSFTEEAEARGAGIEPLGLHQGTSIAFGDYDRDGFVDAYVGEWRPNYIFEGVPPPSNARLLKNRGVAEAGFFDDVTASAGLVLDGTHPDGVFPFSPAFSDLDDDGLSDLVISGDFGTSHVFWNAGDGTFTDGTAAAGVGTDENGMGSAIGDYDGDGRLDWFVTSIYDPAMTCEYVICNWRYSGNRLYRNLGGRTFQDMTDAMGVRDDGWGWGTTFFDYDNDGDLDLVATNDVVFREVAREDAFNDQPMRFWRNDGYTFTEIAWPGGLRDRDDGKGLLTFDYDDDGDLDLFVANNGEPARLYRNEGGNRNHWLRVRLHGTASNRDGYGAKVHLRRTAGGTPAFRELRGGSNYLSQNEAVLHFGLGALTTPVAEVQIVWPSGVQQTLADVSVDQTIDVTEPMGDL